MKYVLAIALGILVFGTGTLSVSAQIPTSVDGITLNITPDNPAPGQSVVVTIESFQMDLSGASIVWLVNNRVFTQGIGITSATVVAPKVGVTLPIKISIKTSEGREVQKVLTLKSGSVDMIWESKGYVPPLFKGKGPFVYQNSVRVIAVPHMSSGGGKEADPKTLVYVWKKNGKYIDNASSYGRQSVDIITDELPRPLDVTVDISTRDQSENASGHLVIEPTEPSISFYEDDLLYGTLFNKALGDKVVLKNSEMKVRAVPYGFNINPQHDYNSYVWSINNIEQPDLSTNQSITIRAKGDVEGSSNIGLNIRNQNQILQGADAAFNISFSKKQEETAF